MAVCLIFASHALPASSTSEILITFQISDIDVAKRLTDVLSKPIDNHSYKIVLDPMTSISAEYIRTHGSPNRFFLVGPTLSPDSYAQISKGTKTAGNIPERTILAVTLSSYGDKVIDDTIGARGTWAKKVISTLSEPFQVRQTNTLFQAMGIRCVGQVPVSEDSVQCTQNSYGAQPNLLIDKTNGTEAFFVWGEKCDESVMRVYRARRDAFRLIAIPSQILDRLKDITTVAYLEDEVDFSACLGHPSLAPVKTGTVLDNIQSSVATPDPEIVKYIALRTAFYLASNFQPGTIRQAISTVRTSTSYLDATNTVYRGFSF